jgi:hypothetical protein
LTNGANSIGTLAGALGNVQFVDATALTVGTVGGAQGIAARGSVSLQTNGIASDLTIASGAAIMASGTNAAVILASSRNFINDSGSSALSVSGGGWWDIYSASPSADAFGGLNSGDTAIWNTSFGGSIAQSGDRYVFSYQPTLTVTSGNLTKIYGTDNSAAVAADFTVTGFQPGVANAFLADSTLVSGTASVSSTGSAATAGVAGGPYAITVAQGSLAAPSGYAIAVNSAGLLTVTARPITVTANGQTQVYGNAVPTLTYAVGGLGLVNGDTLSGVLTTASSSTASVGTYAITQGSLGNGNYAISYLGANDQIIPRPISVSANPQWRPYGVSNPTLTYTLGGMGLVNGNSLAGSLTTTATTTSSIGSYQISQGSIAVSPNYVLSFTGSVLTVGAWPFMGAIPIAAEFYANGRFNDNLLPSCLAASPDEHDWISSPCLPEVHGLHRNAS